MSSHWNSHSADVYVLILVVKINPLCKFLFLDSRVLDGLPMEGT